MIKTELVMPGGDLNKARCALDFGADAVYVGLNKYSLRKGEVRFSIEEIAKIIKYAHKKKKKCYITFNIFAHDKHLSKIEKDIKKIAQFAPDAFIVSDVGVMSIAKKVAPHIPIHISTQANVTNSEQVNFYKKMGAKRIVLARELSLKEIKHIKSKISGIELEVFIHGSMCISYSGRCLLSNYMTNRHANLGDCSQPCRWNYKLTQITKNKSQITNKYQCSNLKNKPKPQDNALEVTINQRARYFLEENMRPGEYFEIEEHDNGTNILSSKDICTIEYIDKMIKAGINGLKIEGRNKTEYYIASTALAYRKAINLSLAGQYKTKEKIKLKKELEKIAHRGYTSGFLFDDAKKGETYQGRSPIKNWEYIGLITKPLKQRPNNQHEVVVKNKIRVGTEVEVLTPAGIKKDKILEIILDNKLVNEISPGTRNQKGIISLENKYKEKSLIRRELNF